MRLAARYSFRYYRDFTEGIRSALAEGMFAAIKRETLALVAEGV
jgi:hypothetical protein